MPFFCFKIFRGFPLHLGLNITLSRPVRLGTLWSLPPSFTLPFSPYTLATLTFDFLELTKLFPASGPCMYYSSSWKVLSTTLCLENSYWWLKSQLICSVFRENFPDPLKNRSFIFSLSRAFAFFSVTLTTIYKYTFIHCLPHLLDCNLHLAHSLTCISSSEKFKNNEYRLLIFWKFGHILILSRRFGFVWVLISLSLIEPSCLWGLGWPSWITRPEPGLIGI